MRFGVSPRQPDTKSDKLDFAAVLKSVWLPLLSWTSIVLFVAVQKKQPGVVCVTPLAWLMACWVGLSSVSRSRSRKKAALLTEAAIAGGLLGLFQGLLFTVIIPLMGEIKPDEKLKAVFISLVMVVLGTLVSALLSLVVGAAQARKLQLYALQK